MICIKKVTCSELLLSRPPLANSFRSVAFLLVAFAGMVSWLLSFTHFAHKHEPLRWQSNLEAGDPGKKGR